MSKSGIFFNFRGREKRETKKLWQLLFTTAAEKKSEKPKLEYFLTTPVVVKKGKVQIAVMVT